MRLDHLEDDLLQRYYDGELSNKRSQGVKMHLEGCPQCQKRHRSLERLHELIKQNAEEMAREVDFDGLYRRVASDVSRERPAGLIEKLLARWDALWLWRPQVWAPAIAVAVTGIAIVVLNSHWRSQSSQPSASVKKPPRSMLAEAPAPTPGSEVVRVDFGGKPGTVFEVALAEGTSTPVIWINDETDDLEIQ